MKLIYLTGRGPLSTIIRHIDGGRWSHVGIIDGDHVIEAVWTDGVRYRRLDSLMEDRPEHEILDVTLPNEAEALQWVRQQIGKPYDFTGVIGLGFGRNWQESSRWYCSELAVTAAVKGGLAAPVNVRRIGVEKSYRYFGGEAP